MTTIKSAKSLVDEANGIVQVLSADAAARLQDDRNVAFVDLREKEELDKSGSLGGALHVPRGLLEFKADPASPTHTAELYPDNHVVLFCGSGSRSALAAKTLIDMGFKKVSHVAGGFPALKKVGCKTEGP